MHCTRTAIYEDYRIAEFLDIDITTAELNVLSKRGLMNLRKGVQLFELEREEILIPEEIWDLETTGNRQMEQGGI